MLAAPATLADEARPQSALWLGGRPQRSGGGVGGGGGSAARLPKLWALAERGRFSAGLLLEAAGAPRCCSCCCCDGSVRP